MSTKTYKTRNLRGLNILIIDDETNVKTEVNFKPAQNWEDNTATFTTDDEDLQSILEACSGYNRDYDVLE